MTIAIPLLLLAFVLVVGVLCLTNRDLQSFDVLKQTDERLWRNTVYTTRFASPVIALLGLLSLTTIPFLLLEGIDTLVVVTDLVTGLFACYLAFRWGKWAWQTTVYHRSQKKND